MFTVGIDLGQKQDHTAIAVLEVLHDGVAHPMGTPRTGGRFLLRHAERVPLGTPYPRVVSRIGEIAGSKELAGRVSLAVDATGVGAPVIDLLRHARLGCEISAVTITGGERETRTASGWSVPRRDLIASVLVLLERGDLKIARRMHEVEALVRELTLLRPGGNAPGEHDDLTIALSLACWKANRGQLQPSMFGNRRLTGL